MRLFRIILGRVDCLMEKPRDLPTCHHPPSLCHLEVTSFGSRCRWFEKGVAAFNVPYFRTINDTSRVRWFHTTAHLTDLTLTAQTQCIETVFCVYFIP
jgi:hypothetical protein